MASLPLVFAFVAHVRRPPSLRRVRGRFLPGPRARWPFSCQLAGQFSGPSSRTSADQLVDRLGQVLPFGRRGPDQPHAVRLDAHRSQHVLEHREAAHGLVVLLDVVAFAGVAAGDQHAVGPEGQGLEHEGRDRPARCTSRG